MRPGTLKCRVKPDWLITLPNNQSYYVEIKSRSYTVPGTASEKLDNVPRKASKVYEETGIKTIVVFVAKQISEKNALEILQPTTSYAKEFLNTSMKKGGIEQWMTYTQFKQQYSF
jgi:hypothetical protein